MQKRIGSSIRFRSSAGIPEEFPGQDTDLQDRGQRLTLFRAQEDGPQKTDPDTDPDTEEILWDGGVNPTLRAVRKAGAEIDRAGIGKIETGIRGVWDYELVALARALRVSVPWMLRSGRKRRP